MMQKGIAFDNRKRFFQPKQPTGRQTRNYGTMLALADSTKNIKLMKTSTNTNALLKAIDFELKELLKKDLENFRMMKENKQVALKKAA